MNNKIIDNLQLSIDQFKDAYLLNDYDENMFKSDGSINPKYNSKKKTGLIAFLHTFGRDLKWNPHIHILLAEIKLSNDKCFK